MVIWIVAIAGCLIGVAAGYLMAADASNDGFAEDQSENFRTGERQVRRQVQRKWRFRLRRRQKELKQRRNQVLQLRERVAELRETAEGLVLDDALVQEVDKGRRVVQSLQDKRKNSDERCAALRERLVEGLLASAGVEIEPFTEGMTHRLIERETGRATRFEREERQRLELEVEAQARQLITQCVLRYAESHSVDRLRTSVRAESEEKRDQLVEMTALFEAELGIALEPSERETMLSLRGADPLMKELGQRLLNRLPKSPVDETAFKRLRSTIEEGMRRESAACSQEAIDQLNTGEIVGERRRLLDRLRYRHSYRQNQWRHAAEVGFLSGMLASELDLDVAVARRGGLMHDIGKSMTHEVEGGHAPLGAEVARQEDECPRVASCIGAHHGDEPPIGLEPFLVAAGDAISGARPGARVQGGEHHETMIRDLERIGRTPRKVDNAYTVRGGRELRVLLAMEDRQGRRVKVNPEEMQAIASDMKARIEDELTYPGTIDVTVIRRVVAEAKAR